MEVLAWNNRQVRELREPMTVETITTSEAEKAAYAAGLKTARKLAEIGGFTLEYSTMATVQDALRAYREAVTTKTP